MTPACCSSLSGGLVSTWLWMSALEAVFLFATSGPVFYYYYARSNVTLDKWMYKSNPKYPSPEKVLIRFFALFLFPTVTSVHVTNCFYRDKTTASSAQQRLVSSIVFSNLRIKPLIIVWLHTLLSFYPPEVDQKILFVKLRQGSGKDRQGMAVKAKGLKA